MPKTPKHERGPRIPDGPQLSIPTDSQRPIKSCLSKLFSKPKLKREPYYYRLEPSSAAPEPCSEHLEQQEQELSDFVKDAIRTNTGPASPPDGSSSSPPSQSQYSSNTTHQTAHPGPAEDSNLMDDWSELATPTSAPGHFKAEEDEQLKPDANSNCQHTTTSRQGEQVFPRCDANTQSDESQVPSNPSCCSAELCEQERQEVVSEEDAVVVWTRTHPPSVRTPTV